DVSDVRGIGPAAVLFLARLAVVSDREALPFGFLDLASEGQVRALDGEVDLVLQGGLGCGRAAVDASVRPIFETGVQGAAVGLRDTDPVRRDALAVELDLKAALFR